MAEAARRTEEPGDSRAGERRLEASRSADAGAAPGARENGSSSARIEAPDAGGAPPAFRENESPRCWIGVVSASHVRRGVQGGFAQLCHGKAARLRQMRAGDWLIYYSPRAELGSGAPLQAFTAIGRVADDRVYEHAMSETFVPFRRNIAYLPCEEVGIAGLLDRLSFTRGKRNWGYPFRMGHFEIGLDDFRTIAAAMLGDVRGLPGSPL